MKQTRLIANDDWPGGLVHDPLHQARCRSAAAAAIPRDTIAIVDGPGSCLTWQQRLDGFETHWQILEDFVVLDVHRRYATITLRLDHGEVLVIAPAWEFTACDMKLAIIQLTLDVFRAACGVSDIRLTWQFSGVMIRPEDVDDLPATSVGYDKLPFRLFARLNVETGHGTGKCRISTDGLLVITGYEVEALCDPDQTAEFVGLVGRVAQQSLGWGNLGGRDADRVATRPYRLEPRERGTITGRRAMEVVFA